VHQAVKIKLTTILGSKGLSYDYVFMVNFDDTYLLPQSGEIDDESINKFLVALTRSRKKISIYTSKNTEPVFVDWISAERKEVY
jgi:superfamily I DNA/RNA helicase